MSESENDHPKIFTAFCVYPGHDDLATLGLVTVLWSQVEFCIEMGVYHFMNLSFKDGRDQKALNFHISQQLDQLSALTDDKCDQLKREAYRVLIARAKTLALRRNLAVHGHWVRLSDHDNKVAAVSWRRVAVGDEIEKLEVSELRGMAAEAGAIAKGFYDLLESDGAFAFMFR